jgi:Tol biopolymer transport system component
MAALRSLVWIAAVVATAAACGGSNPSAGSIVLASDRDGEPEIFVLDRDGGAPLQLTDNDVFDGNPDWSPDGSRLVFTRDRDGGLENYDGGLEIYMMNADGSGTVQLTDDDVDNGAADWSPDGTRIVFDGFDAERVLQVYTMAVDAPGATATQLTTGAANGKPVWSPDGERIAFLSLRDGQRELYVMAADGSEQVNLTNHASFDALAAWSADGTQIAFVSDRSGDREIYTMAADGSDVVRLTHDPGEDSNPSWAHDDTDIMFTSDRGGDVDVYAMARDGSDVRNLTQNPAWDFVPDWTPATSE